MDQILAGLQEPPVSHGDVAGHLDHPALIRIWRHTSHMDLATAHMDKEEDIVRHQAARRPHLGCEEIGRLQHIDMGVNKLLPRGSGLALRGWRDTVAFEDIPDGLGTDGISKMFQGASYTVIVPASVLSGYPHDQGLELPAGLRAAWWVPLLGPVKLLGDEFAMPGENRIGLDDCGNFLQRLFTQLPGDRGQGPTLAIGQAHTALQPLAENLVLRHEVFIAQQFLIDRPRDICQQVLPIHGSLPPPLLLRSLRVSMGYRQKECKP
jgi:hypothetical protein